MHFVRSGNVTSQNMEFIKIVHISANFEYRDIWFVPKYPLNLCAKYLY